MIAEGVYKNNRQLARNLGVSRQRANQMKTSLERLRLVKAEQSDSDGRISLLSLTDKGEAEFKMVEAAFRAELATSLKGREATLARANRPLKILISVPVTHKADSRVAVLDDTRRALHRRATIVEQAK